MSTSRQSKPALLVGVALALVALTLAPALGAKTKKQERAGARVSESVQEHLQRIEAQLVAQEWNDAVSSSSVLLRDFAAKVSGGEAAGPLLGMALMMRAVAEAALQREDDALWHWHSAVALFPEIVDADLAKYGPAAKLLQDNKPSPREPPPSEPPLGTTTQAGTDEEIKPPRPLHTRPPGYPKGMRLACSQGTVVIESLIDEKGRVTQPLIRDAPGGPLAAYAALDSLRDWRFKPATLAGKPVVVVYTLTVRFSIPGCE